MNRLYWHCLRFTERLGVIGWLIAAITLFCIIFIFTIWLPTWISQSESIAGHLTKPAHITQEIVSPEAHLQRFIESLPRLSERANAIQSIMHQAKMLHLEADDVAYKTEQPAQSRLSKTYVDFTLYSTYPELRAFLNNTLAEMPFLSLDQLAINRDDIESDVIQTRMRLTLHLVK